MRRGMAYLCSLVECSYNGATSYSKLAAQTQETRDTVRCMPTMHTWDRSIGIIETLTGFKPISTMMSSP